MKVNYIISVALMAAALSSCDDFLNTMPDNRTQIDTQEKVKELLVSAYPQSYFAVLAELTSDNTDDCGGNYQSSNLIVSKAATWQNVDLGNQNDSPYAVWQAYYSAVAAANQVLESIHDMGDPESMNPQRGEALLCRAYAHFILTNLFCMPYSTQTGSKDLGVPYMTKPETTVSPSYSRGTVAEDYEHIKADIEEGLPLINDNAYIQPAYHFNRKAAYAFAARFYLYYMQDDKSNLDKAIAYADKVLGDSPASLLCNWANIASYSDFGLRSNAFMSSDNASNLLIVSAYSQWMGYYIWDARYTHCKETLRTEDAGAKGPWGDLKLKYTEYLDIPNEIMWKFNQYFNTTDAMAGTGYPYGLYPAFTTDELLLDRAEAYTLKGDYDKAMADMNTFTHNFTTGAPTITADLLNNYYGSGTGAYNYYTPTEPTPKKELHPYFTIPDGAEMYLHAVLNMRRILTMHEGWRWFDVKRYGITIYRRTVENGYGKITVNDTMKRDDPRRALQLPQEVISSGIEANPRTTK